LAGKTSFCPLLAPRQQQKQLQIKKCCKLAPRTTRSIVYDLAASRILSDKFAAADNVQRNTSTAAAAAAAAQQLGLTEHFSSLRTVSLSQLESFRVTR